MPTDRQLTKSSESDLYGIRKPKKNNKTKEISSSTSLAFSSTLSSLLAASSSSSSNTNDRKTSAGRVRPRKGDKTDIFTAHNRNSLKRAARDLEDDERDERGRRKEVGKQDIGGVDNAVLHRSKRKMEEKARLYAAMKRGDYVAGEGEAEGLIDFDRKWAENQKRGTGNELDTSSDDGGDSEDDDGQGEMVEYEDEYGRMRRGTRAEKERCELNARRRELGKQELDRMAARPAMPENLIYGDTVQTAAFNPDEPIVAAMSELAAKRDRSATPPPATHYEADKEIRTKGQGFYSFSKDESIRMKEMESLEKERLETERVRKEKDLRKENRKKEIEERRKEIAEKRARKQADSFLEGLGADMGSMKESESVEEAKD